MTSPGAHTIYCEKHHHWIERQDASGRTTALRRCPSCPMPTEATP